MPRGGARNRSGPPVDPTSGRSDRRGISFRALPAEGNKGRAPKFPLSERQVHYFVDKVRILDDEATELVKKREAEMWRWAWRTPQAVAWSEPSESWRIPVVAMWVRTYVICELTDAKAADKSALLRLGDQIGLSPAGLKENGWAIAAAPAESPAPAQSETTDDGNVTPIRRALSDVG
jgi:hypothetical protein